MYTLSPVTQRVKDIRAKLRNTTPSLDFARYKLVTKFYMENPQLTGILKRAKNLRNLFENMPILINEGEVLVGNQATTFRGAAIYPETSFKWLWEEILAGTIPKRDMDPYNIEPETEACIKQTGEFWLKNNMSAIVNEYFPKGYKNYVGNGVLMFASEDNCIQPVGHFCANFNTAINKGFGAIQREAEEKMTQMEEKGIYDDDIYRYNFYRAISIVSEGIIHWSKRYAKKCEALAAAETNTARKQELLKMADCLNWIMENPCRNFHDAIQCVILYQLAMCLDAEQHGISIGRFDQYLGKFYDDDIATGTITPEYAQELVDLFYLKMAEQNKIWAYRATLSNPGYTSGMLTTIGGVDKDGNDATNAVTYMLLQSAGRLIFHDPPIALRIHKNTPKKLWEAAIETTKISGGVPTFEYDGTIIPALMKRGISLEDARNYCLIGCVEPLACGCEWAQPGGTGTESYCNIVNCYLLAINNGVNPMPRFGGALVSDIHDTHSVSQNVRKVAPATGYLYDMKTFDDVLKAVKTQINFFIKWHINMVNAWESMASFHMPIPILSATMDGCMESGKDVQCGGAKYNSTGNSAIGLGTLIDCLTITKYLCYDKKICTTRELYDALTKNWEGYEELRQIIQNDVPHYGNDDEYADQFVSWVADVYADAVTNGTGPRHNHYAPGVYPVTLNVVFGRFTWATPDGRKGGEPLSDGISACQGMDRNGPISSLNSVLHFDQTKYSNGTLLNMKFHPTALSNESGLEKLKNVMETYFEQGGMEMQLNIVSADTLRDAQIHPENYKDLVVRVAGFSAFFVEVFKESQDDLIRRTEMHL